MENLYGIPPYRGVESSLGSYLQTLREKILNMKQVDVAGEIHRNRSAIERMEKNLVRRTELVRGYTAFIAVKCAERVEATTGEVNRPAFLEEINLALNDFFRDVGLSEEKIPPPFHTWANLERCAQHYTTVNRQSKRRSSSKKHLTTGNAPPYVLRLEDISEFVGRKDERAFFHKQLLEKHLAVITGEFGIGKTFLATRLATELASDPAKLFWHNFEYDRSFENFTEKLSRFLFANDKPALRIAWQRSGVHTPDYLMDVALQSLAEDEFVLCLDDFHLAEGDARVQEFVRRLISSLSNQKTYLLLTSRYVPPLGWRIQDRPLEGLRYPDVYDLFQKRGLAPLAPAQMHALHTVTQGHAYILSLAVSLLQITPRQSDEIIASLERTDDIRRYLFNEVFARLDAPQRAVMNALAVLNEPAPREAIEIVAEAAGIYPAIVYLSDLHLLKFDANLIAGRTYWLRPILRNFFYDLLDTPQKRIMHRRAAAYFAGCQDTLRAAMHYQHAAAQSEAAALFPEIAARDWAWIHTGQANHLRDVLKAFHSEDFKTPLHWVQVQRGLGRVAMFHREVETARAHYAQGLSALSALPQTDETHLLSLQIYLDLAEMLETSLPKQALAYLRRGHEHLRALPEGGERHRGEEIRLYNLMGRVQMEQGELDDAARFFQSALEIAQDEDAQLRIEALLNLGHIRAWQGNEAESQKLYETAHQVCKTSGDDYRRISVLVSMGIGKLLAGDWNGAQDALETAEGLSAVLGSLTQKVELGLTLGVLYTRQGKFTQAESTLLEAIRHAQHAQLYAHEIDALSSLADLYLRQGNFDTAEKTVQIAFERGKVNAYQPPELYRTQALVFLHRGETAQARQSARRALDLSRQDALEEGLSWSVVAQVVSAEGRVSEADMLFQRSYDLLIENGRWEAAQTLTAWGRTLGAASPARARAVFEQAGEIFQSLGAQHDLAIVNNALRSLS